ncbi:MAG: ABC transporter permease [Gammaproteobacteria bacterium]|nr:ABC transporter permease [Gammaproteobacteria bacterium]
MPVEIIPLPRLALAFIPPLMVVCVFYWWSLRTGSVFYAFFRMLVQLMLVGYALVWIFAVEFAWVVLLLTAGMVLISTWIALRTVAQHRRQLYAVTMLSILLGGGGVLILVTQWVLNLEPWYRANFFIPLAGMIFSNSMNGVSLAADRLQAELAVSDYENARAGALRTALIPLVNSLFAVGLVALPGMMTGQILSGVSPLIAARYQIMVMCMLFGAAGLSVILFLCFSRKYFARQDMNNT